MYSSLSQERMDNGVTTIVRQNLHWKVSLAAAIVMGLGHINQRIFDFFSDWGMLATTMGEATNYFVNFSAIFVANQLPDTLDAWVYDKEGELWYDQQRKWTHAWAIFIPLAVASWFFFGNGAITLFFVVYALHCIVDAFTMVGAPVLLPWERVSLMPIKEGTYEERRFSLAMYLVLGAAIYYRWGDEILAMI